MFSYNKLGYIVQMVEDGQL